eukprot:6893394-Prymnesium_polylepis.2
MREREQSVLNVSREGEEWVSPAMAKMSVRYASLAHCEPRHRSRPRPAPMIVNDEIAKVCIVRDNLRSIGKRQTGQSWCSTSG